MITISVKGQKSHARRQFTELAARAILRKLVNDRMNLDVEIVFKKLSKSETEEGIVGLCIVEDYGRSPRMFTVEISSEASWADQLSTLSHELIHVKQYATNELYHYAKLGTYRWRNEKYFHTPYSKRPWEREAYRRQNILLKEFAHENYAACKKMMLAEGITL